MHRPSEARTSKSQCASTGSVVVSGSVRQSPALDTTMHAVLAEQRRDGYDGGAAPACPCPCWMRRRRGGRAGGGGTGRRPARRARVGHRRRGEWHVRRIGLDYWLLCLLLLLPSAVRFLTVFSQPIHTIVSYSLLIHGPLIFLTKSKFLGYCVYFSFSSLLSSTSAFSQLTAHHNTCS